MKGTIISGEEVLKRIYAGEWDTVKNIYAIYSAGKMDITPIVSQTLGAIINDYNDPKIVFIEITKEEQ
jgi:hypothetical protein